MPICRSNPILFVLNMQLYLSTTVHTWYSVNYSLVCVLYIQPKVHAVTGIFSLGWTYLQIVLVQFDNNVSTKPEKYCICCIGNVQAMQLPILILCLYLQYSHLFRSLFQYRCNPNLYLFCRPDLIDFSSLSQKNPAQNLKQAFDVAEKELGIARLLDPEGIAPYQTSNYNICDIIFK